MNVFYDRLRDFFTGKNVLILGFGREGKSTLSLLREFGCKVTIADRNDVSGADTEGIDVISGENYLDCMSGFDVIMKAPGIALLDRVPEDVKPRITGQTDLLLRFCPNRVIGVTGTKGKSTTSSLIHHILSHCGKSSLLIGNIGIPPLDCVKSLSDGDIIVCEMSCHQLEYVQASPGIAVYLNLFEEHLDHYTGFAAYKAAKENIYRFQSARDTLIINSALVPESCASSLVTASLDGDADITVTDGAPVILGEKCPVTTKLLGRHNLYNIGIAMYAAGLCGVGYGEAAAAVSSFDGLKHRLEKVGVIDGVTYINDSISTCPSTAIAAVRAFDGVDTIIVGGMDRGIDYTELIDFLNASDIANVILLPDSGHRIEDRLDHNKRSIYRAADLEDAVKHAKKVTKHICLLSPAAASYGFYKNFEERGAHFVSLLGGKDG
ncbi:MAG: UDP-N-acetylmuramoyl-L-alanine--D-glutamate ligase [Ruminiclostridium sp.]|nr:UDP-N-acetylmuramoyl-L-alanine--D-glutamate ligase [Ruminiclostridium sp.]